MNRSTQAVVVAFIICAGVGAWWALNPPAPAAAAETPKPAPTIASAPHPAAPIDQPKPRVELPVAPPVPVQPTVQSEPAKTEPPAADPQAELSTLFPDLIRRMQAGDFLALMQDYVPPDRLAQMPPERRAQMEQQVQRASSDPRMQVQMQMMIQVLQTMQSQTPTYNDTGDVATYEISDPTGQSQETDTFKFRKINGKWYIDEAM